MINAGAILVCSLLKTLVNPEMTLAEKFDYTQSWFQKLSGGGNSWIAYLVVIPCLSNKLLMFFFLFSVSSTLFLCVENFGFNNSIFLSEREAADRNYALGFYMREHKVFPEKTNLRECLDFYFQVKYNPYCVHQWFPNGVPWDFELLN